MLPIDRAQMSGATREIVVGHDLISHRNDGAGDPGGISVTDTRRTLFRRPCRVVEPRHPTQAGFVGLWISIVEVHSDPEFQASPKPFAGDRRDSCDGAGTSLHPGCARRSETGAVLSGGIALGTGARAQCRCRGQLTATRSASSLNQ